MGAWGHKNFENDDAGDWVYDLEKSKDKSVIHQALDTVLNNQEYLEAPDCCVALAAAEVVYAGKTSDHSRVSEDVSAWLNRKHGFIKKKAITFDSEDVSKSIQAVGKILDSSELKELWEESDDFQSWVDLQIELIANLEERA
ncbi:hypothetical protein H010_03662 [Hydrogenophaga taeniospiralis CCUG 15921]|uniref:DUF4259 domain-containing protein n=1 Tax=Hydrogenophaga taeniospiralis CCUG 15921 TaxID=1281780 RepID=A0A9X4NN64_9BURK|nr:DUF4259 domain-containing protein [Hydrogenophaga taeniospiralis]MDG5974333.1 hypothetical protein [Hydrogenophaga taeniospiralis CCUG 15921]